MKTKEAAKRTPGPWKGGSGLCDEKGMLLIRDSYQGTVAKAYTVENARLIAAAPDLLAALKEVVALSDRKHDAWDKAHAAILRAEGK